VSRRQCTALNVKGVRCGSFAVTEDSLCEMHRLTPEERKARSARGGRKKGTNRLRQLPVEFSDLAWIIEYIVSVVNGTLSPRTAARMMSPLIAHTPGELRELERVLSKINPPQADEEDEFAATREWLAFSLRENFLRREDLSTELLALITPSHPYAVEP
jgi:hypothetical protein